MDLRLITKTIGVLLIEGAWKATSYVSEKEVVRATRRLTARRIDIRGNVEISLTIGKPNFAERKFIKLCKKAGEPFPVEKVQLKFIPKKR